MSYLSNHPKNPNNPHYAKFHFDNLFVESPYDLGDVIVYQVGDLYCESGYELLEHEQYCDEISYIVSGKGSYRIDNKWFPVKKGDLILCSKGQLHMGAADSLDPYRYFYIGFDISERARHETIYADITKIFKSGIVLHNHPEVESNFIGVFDELISLQRNANIMILTYIQQLLLKVVRAYYGEFIENYIPQQRRDPNSQLVYEIIQYIDVNFENIENLNQISESLGYSYSYISHLFTDQIGISMQQYYSQKRFEAAISMLKRSDLSITEIAYKLKYQSLHAFSKAFHKHFGLSPSDYSSLFHQAKT